MAKVLRLGKTPFWGTVEGGLDTAALLIDSVNYSTEVKDYEQQNELGAIKGYLVYDQTVGFDISGTMLFNCGNPYESTGATEGLAMNWNNPFKIGASATGGTGSTNTALQTILSYVGNWALINNCATVPSTAIIKTNSVSTTAGGAATFSASGTIYDFS